MATWDNMMQHAHITAQILITSVERVDALHISTRCAHITSDHCLHVNGHLANPKVCSLYPDLTGLTELRKIHLLSVAKLQCTAQPVLCEHKKGCFERRGPMHNLVRKITDEPRACVRSIKLIKRVRRFGAAKDSHWLRMNF